MKKRVHHERKIAPVWGLRIGFFAEVLDTQTLDRPKESLSQNGILHSFMQVFHPLYSYLPH